MSAVVNFSDDDFDSFSVSEADGIISSVSGVNGSSEFDGLVGFDGLDGFDSPVVEPKEITGFIAGMSNHDYHSKDALSTSGIKIYKESPTQYWYYRNTPQQKKRVFDVGNMFHEINQFGMDYVKEWYVQQPDFDLRSPQERLERDRWEESLTDNHCIITYDDWNLVLNMRESVFKNKTAKELIEHPATTFEDSFFWHDEETGVWCRCRTDIWNPEYEIATDLKSMDANLTWGRSVLDRHYHVQDALYTEGIRNVLGVDLRSGGKSNFWFLVSPKKLNSYTEFKTISQDLYDKGREIYRETLRSFASCQAEDSWFAPTETIVPFFKR